MVGSSRTAVTWRGAGGRWLVWVGRAVIWAVIVLVGYRGVLAIFDDQGTQAPVSHAPVASARPAFPVAAASAYALEFGQVYLNFGPGDAATRSRELAAFLPPGSDAQLGWNGSGVQRLVDEQVADVRATSAHSGVVTLLAELATGHLIELGVPVYADSGGLVVSGEPALLPAPAKAALPAASDGTADQATQQGLQAQLTAFFEAYASGDEATLARFVAPGADVTGLGGSVTLGTVDGVYVPAGGTSRAILATVTWQLPSQSAVPATLQMTYQMTVVQRDGTWDVKSIGASTQQLPGPP